MSPAESFERVPSALVVTPEKTLLAFAEKPRGDCQDFRVWAGIMGKKESHYVPTQGTGDTG